MALTYLLQKSFSNAQIFKGENRAVIVPRPHLDKFIEYLNQIKDKIDIGIFSTASSFYLSTVLSNVIPWAIGNCVFIWDIAYCDFNSGMLAKDLRKVEKEFGYSLENIKMIDDQDIVLPESLRIPAIPFNVQNIHLAKNDTELLRLINCIEVFISY